MFNRTIVKIFNLDQAELDCEIAHRVNMDICHAFFKRYLLIGKGLLCVGGGGGGGRGEECRVSII